jgi:large conductance mechanosensitive channel
MKSFIEEFKAFAVRGNVIDLAVAVVIGTAFGKIVSSLVDNIIMPVVGALSGGIDFSGYAYRAVTYGKFVQSVVDFVIVAFVVFLVMKAINNFKKKEEGKPAPTPSEEVLLLREIRDFLKK